MSPSTRFRVGIDTFAEGGETKGDIKFHSSTGATLRVSKMEFRESKTYN